MIQERRIGEHVWYLLSREFPTALAAKHAWERLEHATRKQTGSLGLYRHKLPDGSRDFVTILSTERDQVVRAGRRLTFGEPFELPDDEVDALILRRARYVVEHHDGTRQRDVIRRPENRGAVITRSGHSIEHPPGRG